MDRRPGRDVITCGRDLSERYTGELVNNASSHGSKLAVLQPPHTIIMLPSHDLHPGRPCMCGLIVEA